MKNETLFSEKQKFQWWVWIVLLGTNGLFAYGVITQVFLGKTFGDKPAPDAVLIIVFVFTLSLALLFYTFTLETLIKTDGIYVRFYPIHAKFRYYPWEQIRKAYIRQYKPISEYGGWGLRGFGKNRALNVSGNQGLQLELEDYRRLLIGTQKPEEITEVLKKTRKAPLAG